jgi:uncharacterized protein DUF1236
MKLIPAVSAAFLLLATAPFAFAESSCPTPTPDMKFEQLPEKCRAELDTWAKSQPDSSIDVQGDIVVGTVVPDTVQFVEVPVYNRYGYVVVNKKRVLVDRDTRTVIKVY